MNHCVHGDGVVLEEVLDWRPPDYWTVRFEVPGAMVGMMTDSVEPFGDGSKVTVRVRVEDPVDPEARQAMLAAIVPLVDAAAAGLENYVATHPIKRERIELPSTDEASRLATAILG